MDKRRERERRRKMVGSEIDVYNYTQQFNGLKMATTINYPIMLVKGKGAKTAR
jgi:hypothetical protein